MQKQCAAVHISCLIGRNVEWYLVWYVCMSHLKGVLGPFGGRRPGDGLAGGRWGDGNWI